MGAYVERLEHLAALARLVAADALVPGPARIAAVARAREMLIVAGFRFCRKFGCSQFDACPGSCAWAGPDLCSACAPNAENH